MVKQCGTCLAPVEASTADYSERGWFVCRTCSELEATARVQDRPLQATHSLTWWFMMGLSPAFLYFLSMALAYSPAGTVIGGLVAPYLTLMPIFALGWLAALTRNRPTIDFRDAPPMTRGAYLLRCLGANTIVWLFFVILYIATFTFH